MVQATIPVTTRRRRRCRHTKRPEPVDERDCLSTTRPRRSPARLRKRALQAPLDGDHSLPPRAAGDHRVHVHATPIYEARTRLLIEADDPNIVSFKGVIDKGPGGEQTTTRRSTTSCRAARWPAARSTSSSLWDTAALRRSTGGTVAATAGARRRSSSRSLVTQVSRQPLLPTQVGEQSRAIDQFLDNLTISPVRNSRLVDVRYRSPEPATLRRWPTALAKNYIEQNLEYKFMASKEASDWLGERLAEQRRRSKRRKLALQQYREQNDAISLEDRENIVVQKLADLNAAVTQAKTERMQKEAMYQQLQCCQAGHGGARHVSGDSRATRSSSSRRPSWRSCSASRRSCPRSWVTRHPEMVKLQVGDPDRAGEARRRNRARSCRRCATNTRPRWRRRTA